MSSNARRAMNAESVMPPIYAQFGREARHFFREATNVAKRDRLGG